MADDETGEIHFYARDCGGKLISEDGETVKIVKTTGDVKIEYAD